VRRVTFRFGLQISSLDPAELIGRARAAEAAGFDVVLVADHVGARGPSPLPALAAIAASTSWIRLGTLVVNADMRNPVHLAWEISTLDHLSGGRVELGLGAGHTPQEYAACGMTMDPPRVRKERLCEIVELVRRLLDGEVVTSEGARHLVAEAAVPRSVQERLPILVGGNGDALLAHAARHADSIGLQGLGRTGPDGYSHDVRWDPAHLDAQVERIRAASAAAGRPEGTPELGALVQVVRITDDREAALAELCEQVTSLDLDHARATPYLAVGTVDQIVEQFLEARRRWDITYLQVRDLDGFRPVVDGLRAATSS
jgi:probable F420-dependent oxidoreductase